MVDDLAQVNRSSVAKLTSPISKLMATVAHGKRIHARKNRIAAKDIRKFLDGEWIEVEVEQITHFAGISQQPWLGNRRWHDARIAGLLYLSTKVSGFRIARQIAGKAIVEVQRFKLVDLCGHCLFRLAARLPYCF